MLDSLDEAGLDELEARSIAIIREAYFTISPLCVLWSMGKDSTALLWLIRKAFLGDIPFPVVLLDTEMELDEVYTFRDELAAAWQLDLRNELCPPESETDATLPPNARAAARKTLGLRRLIEREGFRGIFAGIRRDEQATRAKERVFSPRGADGSWDLRSQPLELRDLYQSSLPHGAHMRIHPLLHWTEIDVWKYTQREKIPYVPLYLATNGLRYRSLGEKNITSPIASNAASIEALIAELQATNEPERAGRLMDRESEDSFDRLRRSGYM